MHIEAKNNDKSVLTFLSFQIVLCKPENVVSCTSALLHAVYTTHNAKASIKVPIIHK